MSSRAGCGFLRGTARDSNRPNAGALAKKWARAADRARSPGLTMFANCSNRTQGPEWAGGARPRRGDIRGCFEMCIRTNRSPNASPWARRGAFRASRARIGRPMSRACPGTSRECPEMSRRCPEMSTSVYECGHPTGGGGPACANARGAAGNLRRTAETYGKVRVDTGISRRNPGFSGLFGREKARKSRETTGNAGGKNFGDARAGGSAVSGITPAACRVSQRDSARWV